MNTPITWVPALATTSRHASIVSRISSGVRPIELTESSTGDCRSAETSALKVNRSGSPTLVRSDPTITRICGLISAFVSMNLETICWRALSLSRRASCSVTPTACSRVCSTLTTERSASVRFSSACTAGRNMLVFAVWASISTTPNATTFRPSPGSGLMMLTFLRLTMTPLKSMICLTCDCVVHADHCNWEGAWQTGYFAIATRM